MKLKTLKELEEGKYMYKGLVQLRHVRDEAIKWIKKINKDGGMCHTCDELWFDFFNITEEDLK